MRDIAIALDSTGSMQQSWYHIKPVIEQARLGPDDKLMVVQYWDHSDPRVAYVTDLPGVIINPDGGGDEPEAVFDGLVVAGNLPWRTEAERFCILIGDAGPHCYYEGYPLYKVGPPRCQCGITLGGVAELFAYNQIKFFTHLVNTTIPAFIHPDTRRQLEQASKKIRSTTPAFQAFNEIAEACGGTFVDLLTDLPIFSLDTEDSTS